MSGLLSLLKRGGIAVVICIIAGAYPLWMFFSHDIPSRFNIDTTRTVWADARIGAAVQIIEDQTRTRGWVTAKPDWHAQSKLTAMPAFQEGVADALSRFVTLRAELATSGAPPDEGLTLASSLLNQSSSPDGLDKLSAVLQALRRFDGMKARSVFADMEETELLAAETALYQQILADAHDDLRRIAEAGKRSPIHFERTALYYRIKGRIYVIGVMLGAIDPDDVVQPGFRNALEDAQHLLERAYRPSPVIVSNPVPGGFSLSGSDIVELAYLIDEVEEALSTLSGILDENLAVPEPESLTES